MSTGTKPDHYTSSSQSQSHIAGLQRPKPKEVSIFHAANGTSASLLIVAPKLSSINHKCTKKDFRTFVNYDAKDWVFAFEKTCEIRDGRTTV